ncbi:carbon-nitrogen hydrolase family protein [uncultured Draconibacterium sp.]|uniref:carbon-nitrogen hydrolase family protein n=1 Tax=uncultured Draconibacterium sp. TaxID=1573823 RepID=UPI0032610BD5
MRIAIAQIKALSGNIEKNIENHLKWIKQAIVLNADFVVFPELSLTGYEPDLAAQLATHKNDPRLDEFQKLSDENNITIGVGMPTREEGLVFVSMVIFQANMERINYSKQHLYPPEKTVFTAGKNPMVLPFDTGVVAPAICYEAGQEEHCAYAQQNNAGIYVASVLSSVNGIDAELKKLRNIASDKKLLTFMANYVGKSGGYECAGKSSVWNEKGELLGQLGEKKEGMLLFDSQTKELLTKSS